MPTLEGNAHQNDTAFLTQVSRHNCIPAIVWIPSKEMRRNPLVLVWGDSHAADLVFGFRSLQPQSGVRLAQYTASLCPPVVGLQLRERPACQSINSAVIGYIKALKPNIVVLSGVWDFYLAIRSQR
jgi:hypothetical protein